MRPPRLAEVLLLAVAGPCEAEWVAGDLEEEFLLVCQSRDPGAGNRWYIRQVLRSLVPLLSLRLRSGELREAVVRSLLRVAVPLLILDRLWCFVYSQIPLKDGVGRAPGFLLVNVLAACVGAASTRKPLAACAAAALAMWASVGAVPPAYLCAVLVLVTISSLMTSARRRSVR